MSSGAGNRMWEKEEKRQKIVTVEGDKAVIHKDHYRNSAALEEALKAVAKIHRQKMRAGRGKRNQVE